MSRFGVGAAQPEQADQLLDHLERLGLGLPLVGPLDRVVHEHDVGVRAVALLGAAEPAHAHDEHPGERRRPGALLEVAQADLEGDLEQGGGEVGHRRTEGVEGQRAGEVGHGDAEQLGAPDGARGEHRGCRVVLAPGRRPHPAQHVLARARLQPGGVTEELHALRAPARAGRRRTGCGPGCAPAARPPTPRRAAAAGTSASSRARR